MASQRELIVVAAPRSGDPYYAEVANDIFDFHIAYAEAVDGKDDFLVLADEGNYARYAEILGEDKVALAPQEDIWARDFSLSNASDPVMFRYTAEGQGGGRTGQRDADAVQEVLAAAMEEAGLVFGESDLLNDGGNLVDDYVGRVILSRKFLRDNRMSESRAGEAVIAATGASAVAFIEADEQGGLEHADGVAAFIGPNTVVVNSYPDDPDYAAELRDNLESAFPNLTLH
ncbi:MAG: agmatine deiminase family protein, partial [Pseudomonadota bacterium]